MKTFCKIAIAGSILAASQAASAAQLKCEVDDNSGLFFKLEANVSESYSAGKALTILRDLKMITDTGYAAVASAKIDPNYRSRLENRVRINLEPLDATNGRLFDGIVHGLIFPKALGTKDIITKDALGLTFKAKVAASTDSYHDEIISYFSLGCSLESRR